MFANLIPRLISLLYVLPCALFALTVHETAHGWMAYRLGDPTARNLGRLTLNPMKHLDPLGTLCMVFFHFGWARPVPINARYFKKPRRDTALTAAAGPVSNFLLAFAGFLVSHILLAVFRRLPIQPNSFGFTVAQSALTLFGYYFPILNISLGLFNLIPVPPLDGSRIFLVWLPAKYYFGVMKYERYIQLALLVLLWTDILTLPLSYGVQYIAAGMEWLIGLIPFL